MRDSYLGFDYQIETVVVIQDALSMTEFELMELLDVGMKEIRLAIALISEATSPPCQSVSSLLLLQMMDMVCVIFNLMLMFTRRDLCWRKRSKTNIY